jgi:hypothetical protein
MASIRRLRARQGDRYEIRECLTTERGPRQHTLASFSGALTPEVLDQAQEKALRPFEREKIFAKAREMGIPVHSRRRHPEARALLAKLQRGEAPDPTLVDLLRAALEPLRSEPVPSHLRDAAAWVGQSERERGRALRGLLRTTDRIVRSRGPLRTRPREVFPRFSSERHRS